MDSPLEKNAHESDQLDKEQNEAIVSNLSDSSSPFTKQDGNTTIDSSTNEELLSDQNNAIDKYENDLVADKNNPDNQLRLIAERIKNKVANYSTIIPTPLMDLFNNINSSGETFDSHTQMRVALSWDSEDDLDLHIQDPKGETIYYLNRNSEIGGRLDLDANSHAEHLYINPIETISWKNGSLIEGEYSIFVDLYKKRSNLMKIPYQITIWKSGNEKPEVTKGFIDSNSNSRKQEVKKEFF